ncbi:uncharacterized protein LOC127122937 [Lathyrus oleraceus]|uniref:uncharacterized protein LOC127122937 n=1 Tax=Pisum sativum TaxID=3888 RepID=UPI0021D0D94A|nr:uncharacterized protein LOC127122937 [Pisum sativum]
MDFVIGLPNTPKGSDIIWVIIDKLTKTAHFISIKISFLLQRLAEIYIDNIMKLHGIPSYIVFDRDPSYHSSIGMDTFEALYGRRCRTPVCWYEFGESVVLGPEIVQQTTEKVKMIQEKMKASHSRQKSYHDKRMKDLEFREGDHLFMRVTLVTGVGHALKSKKLTPCFIGPYQITQKIGVFAYRVALPPSLLNLHDVFHVSHLRKYIHDPSHMIQMDDVQVRDNLTVEVSPIQIKDREVKQLRDKEIVLVKVVWGGPAGGNMTWELESRMKESYPELFLPNVDVFISIL